MVRHAEPRRGPRWLGRRVFSGAYAASDTPIAAFLDDMTTLKGAHLYLVDATGVVIATNGQTVADVRTLGNRDPTLARVSSAADRGTYRAAVTSYFFAKSPVPGTSWSLLIAAPSSGIFVSVRGSSEWGPWLILACPAAFAGLAGWLGIRFYEERQRLKRANLKLLELATRDPLTGLSNRRHLSRQLEILLANARRGNLGLCVLMIDIDNFKRLNDSLGHQAGDKALCHVATTLAGTLRDRDLLARWAARSSWQCCPPPTGRRNHRRRTPP